MKKLKTPDSERPFKPSAKELKILCDLAAQRHHFKMENTSRGEWVFYLNFHFPGIFDNFEMTEKKKIGRGGARPGAGRPRKKVRRVVAAFRVLPETKETFERLRAEGYDVNDVIDDLAADLKKDLLLDEPEEIID